MFEAEQEFMEKIISRVRETLSPEATIIQNDRIISSRNEKIAHDVFLSIRHQIFQYQILLIVERTDKPEKVTKFQIEKFYAKVQELQANRGVYLSDSGFTEEAIRSAARYSMDLCSLEEAKSKNWSEGLVVPTICDFRRPELLIHFFGDIPKNLNFNGTELTVQIPLEAGGEITLYRLFQLMWNDAWIPQEVGEYEYNIPVYKPVTIQKDNKEFTIKQIVFKIGVNSQKYFGYLDIETCRRISRQIQADEKTEGDENPRFDISAIIREWENITDLDSPINFPTMILEFREQVI
jgi:hypothetical protein